MNVPELMQIQNNNYQQILNRKAEYNITIESIKEELMSVQEKLQRSRNILKITENSVKNIHNNENAQMLLQINREARSTKWYNTKYSSKNSRKKYIFSENQEKINRQSSPQRPKEFYKKHMKMNVNHQAYKLYQSIDFDYGSNRKINFINKSYDKEKLKKYDQTPNNKILFQKNTKYNDQHKQIKINSNKLRECAKKIKKILTLPLSQIHVHNVQQINEYRSNSGKVKQVLQESKKKLILKKMSNNNLVKKYIPDGDLLQMSLYLSKKQVPIQKWLQFAIQQAQRRSKESSISKIKKHYR